MHRLYSSACLRLTPRSDEPLRISWDGQELKGSAMQECIPLSSGAKEKTIYHELSMRRIQKRHQNDAGDSHRSILSEYRRLQTVDKLMLLSLHP